MGYTDIPHLWKTPFVDDCSYFQARLTRSLGPRLSVWSGDSDEEQFVPAQWTLGPGKGKWTIEICDFAGKSIWDFPASHV